MKLPAYRFARLRRSPLVSPRLWIRRIAFWAGAILVSLIAISFARLADMAIGLFGRGMHVSSFLALLICPAGMVLAVWLTQHVFPGAQGSGIPQVIAALHTSDERWQRKLLTLRVAFGKILLTVLGLATGASIGREGPTVQVGATVMFALGRLLRVPRQELRGALILAGGAAGVSSAFNTPLAGIVFAIEELSHSFEARTSGMVLTAVIIAGITTLAFQGNYTYFGVSSAELPLNAGWWAVLLCAAGGGLAGGLFSRILIEVAQGLPGRAGRFVRTRPIAFAALCGLALALIGLVAADSTYGTGYQEARQLVEGHSHLPASYAVLKFAATIISYVSGIPGGIFAPSLAVGAGLGQYLSGLVPGAPSGTVVLLGMVAYFSGVVQAPITATIIVMEMTDNQSLTIPLLATSMLAYGFSRLICRRPLYGMLARRFAPPVPPATAPDPV